MIKNSVTFIVINLGGVKPYMCEEWGLTSVSIVSASQQEMLI